MRKECKKIKEALTNVFETTIEVDNFFAGKDLQIPISRAIFERECEKIFKDAMYPVFTAMDAI